ncbi:MAG: AraC family transcriptional regulator [Oscillospiraceae bacterium]|nr:AraC family transcriptional regulator [Oscillospiraceae bacterium]
MNEKSYKNENMQSLFKYIENNLEYDVDTKLLSVAGYVSHAKLYRDFYSMSGHSVKEYVRKRQLSNALALIKASDMGFTDIAFQCGYSSYLTLWRAVRQTLGLTPSEYKNGNTYYFFPPFKGNPIQPVTVSNDTIPRALRVLYYHTKLTGIENAAIQTFLQIVPNYNGRIFGRNGKQSGSRFCYELYLTDTSIDCGKLNGRGFKTTNIIPCFTKLFAVSTVRNDEKKINAAWNYLYYEWLQNSMFAYTNEMYYEEYILKNSKLIKLKLYLPIKKREEETKIVLAKNPELRFIIAKAAGYNAEKVASEMVFNYMKANYLETVMDSKVFYLQKYMNCCVCGIKTDTGLQYIKDMNIMDIATDKPDYLVLESDVAGNYGLYAGMLIAFARDNGINIDESEIFAVYNAKDSFNNLKIKMYCPLHDTSFGEIDTK